MTQADTPNPIDKDVLKKAFKAFKRRLKLTQLDADSNLNYQPTSAGQRSTIMAIQPPNDWPTAVWDELVKQGKLKAARHGMYEMGEQE